jgi:hypothetical protein
MADFSDRERLDWLSRECSETDIWIVHDGVEREAGNFYRVTVDDGEKIYHGGSTRQCLDAAMLASGLVPQERESNSQKGERTYYCAFCKAWNPLRGGKCIDCGIRSLPERVED